MAASNLTLSILQDAELLKYSVFVDCLPTAEKQPQPRYASCSDLQGLEKDVVSGNSKA